MKRTLSMELLRRRTRAVGGLAGRFLSRPHAIARCNSFSSASNVAEKAERLSLQPLRGTHDAFGSEVEVAEAVEDVLQRTAESFGFKRVRTPVMEAAELYHRSLGDGSDVVMKEMYCFTDLGGRQIALRPEGTAGVMRAALRRNKSKEARSKLFYSGEMFRYERPQKGRYREFRQFGVEYIGEGDLFADVEVISMAYEALKRLGIKTELQINSLGDNESREAYKKSLSSFLSGQTAHLSADSLERTKSAGIDHLCRLKRGSLLRILDSKDEGDKQLLQEAPMLADFLSESSSKRFAALRAILDQLQMDYTINDKLVRGLDYYCETIFEFIEQGNGLAVLAGGRYDGLAKIFTGQAVPSIGWAAGLDRLALYTDPTTLSLPRRLRVAVLPVRHAQALGETIGEEELISKASQIAGILRRPANDRQEMVVEIVAPGPLKKLLKKANAVGVDATVLIGEDEIASQSFKIRNMKTSVQVSASESELASCLLQLCSPNEADR